MAGPVPVLHNGQGSVQGIWDFTSSPEHRVGQRASLDDGRVFYYARSSGAAIVAGNLLMSELPDTQNEDLVTGNDVAIGDTVINVTPGSTTNVANAFAEGYMVVNDDTGEGKTYKIESHPAVVASTALNFTLRDPVNVAWGDNTTVTLVKNPYMDVVIAAAAQAHYACGVAQVAVDSGTSTSQYFWVQTWGISACWSDATSAVGSALMSGATAGRVEAASAISDQHVGVQVSVQVDGENNAVMLMIAP